MEETVPRFRLGWWWLAIIALGLVGAATLTLALWIRTSGDLDAEVARAKRLGVPTTWEELGLPTAVPEDQRRMTRFQAIALRAKFDGPKGTIMEPSSPFLPPGEELLAWHSGVDAELDELINELAGEPCWSIDPAAVRYALGRSDARGVMQAITPGGWDPRYDAANVLAFRSASGRDDPAHLSGLFLRLARSQPIAGLSGILSSNQIAVKWIKHVLRHRLALDAAETAHAASDLADRLDRAMLLAVRVEAVTAATIFRLPADDLMRAWNIRLPSAMIHDLPRQIFYRSGRKPIVARYVDAADWVAKHGLPGSQIEITAACPAPETAEWSNMHRTLLSLTMEGSSCSCHSHGPRQTWLHTSLVGNLRNTLQLRLLAADLVGGPWPQDPQDPAGRSLRTIVRDGVIIGGYSLGSDGIDNGGDQKLDWCWALRAQLGSPKASDPVKLP